MTRKTGPVTCKQYWCTGNGMMMMLSHYVVYVLQYQQVRAYQLVKRAQHSRHPPHRLTGSPPSPSSWWCAEQTNKWSAIVINLPGNKLLNNTAQHSIALWPVAMAVVVSGQQPESWKATLTHWPLVGKVNLYWKPSFFSSLRHLRFSLYFRHCAALHNTNFDSNVALKVTSQRVVSFHFISLAFYFFLSFF